MKSNESPMGSWSTCVMIAWLAVVLIVTSGRMAEASVLAVCNDHVLSRYDVNGGAINYHSTVWSSGYGHVRDAWVDASNDDIYYLTIQGNYEGLSRNSTQIISWDHSWSYNTIGHFAVDPLRRKIITEVEQSAHLTHPDTWLNRRNLDTGSFEETIYSAQESYSYVYRVNAAGWEYWTRDYYHEIEDVAINPFSGQVYWTDSTEGTIRRMNLDGTGGQVVYSGLINPESLALDVAAGRLFFTDDGDATHLPGIYTASMDGSSAVGVAVSGFADDQHFGGLAVDPSTAKLYWTETPTGGGASTLFTADYDGTNVAQFLNASGDPIHGGVISLGLDPGITPQNPLMPDWIDPDNNFHFQAIPVPREQTIFFDPEYAIGYDFSVTGSTFASVMLPHVGDGMFQLFLWNGSQFIFEGDLAAGEQFFFGGDGVDLFRILGIEDLEVEVGDPTGFLTALGFTAEGSVDVTMAPITEPPTDVVVPEVSSIVVWSLLLGTFAVAARFRRRK